MSETDLYFLYGLAGGLIPSLILIWVQVRMIRLQNEWLDERHKAYLELLEDLLEYRASVQGHMASNKAMADEYIATLHALLKMQGFDMMDSNTNSVEPYETD